MASHSKDIFNFSGVMKNTLAITLKCNLACDYCYIRKSNSVMTLPIAHKIIDFIFANANENDKIEIGFFGGEPLLEFNLIKKITRAIQTHESFDPERVTISLTTNGTIFSEGISRFIQERDVTLNISCDGPKKVQDITRHFSNGHGSSEFVERTIRKALKISPLLPVNAVYSPENLLMLPDVVDYLSSLGVKNIYLNPNISAKWTKKDADLLPDIYKAIGKKFLDFYLQGEPKYISLIDGPIAVILRGGYKPPERCRMGRGDFAFGPSGNIYPCERLIGADEGKEHCIGNICEGFIPEKTCKSISSAAINIECQSCGIKEYCMNWCGCTNYYSAGAYNTVSPFICASERAAINLAFQIIQDARNNGLDFLHHLAGAPQIHITENPIREGEM